MRTSRLTVTTTIVLSLAGAAAATSETLELRIVSTNGAALVNVHANEAFVGVKIQGRLTGGTTAGLGMWMADVRNSGTAYVNMSDSGEFHVAAPTAVADHFGRTPGFDNPAWGSPPRAGYTGSASDDADVLAQIGGGQNTMGNASGAYPLGTVSLDVGNSGWTDLATGSVYFAGSLGDTVELNLERAFATTINSAQFQAPYRVTPARVDVVGGLTIRRTVELLAAYSVGLHADATTDGWRVELPITLGTDASTVGLSEPRLFATGANDEDLWLRLAFTDDVSTSGVTVTVTPDPGATLTVQPGAYANEIALVWDGQPTIDLSTNGYAYKVELGGLVSGQFGIAYITGDVDGGGFVSSADSGVIANGSNFFQTICAADNPRADLYRGGIVSVVNIGVVTSSAYWQKPVPLYQVTINASPDPIVSTCP
ncbi:MAG TPA: hypothetical protein P5572_17415 [Phycisphaerae bacterium]|nr:hypothetical protein [Phycisphaerales bacterium]HRX86808.1 hypothetical protein [Phycisphaerae bacterium]